jgi:hypothetical protein
MLDSKVVDTARRGVAPRLEKQMEEVSHAVGTVVAKVAAGQIRGTGGAIQTMKPCVAIVAPTVEIAWKNLWKVVTTLHVRPAAQDLKDELREELSQFFESLRSLLELKATFTGGGTGNSSVAMVTQRLDTEVRRAMQIAEAEIDLFVHEQSDERPSAVPGGGGDTINIYSQVGSIQTGAGATAVISQYLDENRDALRGALRDLRAVLTEESSGSVNLGDLVEMMTTAEAELSKSKPNTTFLGSMLMGIATSVQTLANVQPAYVALKAAAAAVGISLP